jgi:hypothetical protein
MSDPRRMLDDAKLSTSARTLLEQYQALVPPEGAQEAVAAKLAAALASTGANVTGAGAAVAAKSGLTLLPKVLLATVLAASGGLVVQALRPRAERATASASAPATTTGELGSVQPETDTQSQVPDEEAASDQKQPERSIAKLPRHRRRPPAIKAPDLVAEPAPVSAPLPQVPVSSKTSLDATRLAEEAALIESAQRALRTQNSALALTLVEEAAHAFGDGQLRQERDAIRIEALLHLRRKDEARQKANHFRQAYPSSPHLKRIDALLQGEAN